MKDRGVSTTLSYVFSLVIIMMLLSGLFGAAGDIVEDQQERVIRSEMRVVGNHLAADIRSVDRLSLRTSDGGVRVTSDLPGKLARRNYIVRIENPGGDRYRINISSKDPHITESTFLRTNATLVTNEFNGGNVEISFNGSHIEVEHV